LPKQLDLPPEVARAFAKDMRAFFAEESLIRRDEIVARQLSALNEYRGRRDKPLRLSDVKDMFQRMKDQVGSYQVDIWQTPASRPRRV
jgi:hypothetical protein